MLHLVIKNESIRKYLYRGDALHRLANRMLAEERKKPLREPWPHAKTPLELSVLFCDDPFIAGLNKEYRNKRGPTDVLSFAQEFEHHGHPEILGDIVISLETVERFCEKDRHAMRAEVRLLFCHGFLHILGHDHGTKTEREDMNLLQAHYLGISKPAAWHAARRGNAPKR